MKKMKGVIVAMTTPFDANGKINIAALEDFTEFLIEKNVNCLYPNGTTGEMYSMSPEERELVAETVVKKAAGRIPVFIHTGAMTQNETIRLSKHAYQIGADGIGVVTPSYFGINDKAMKLYYQTIAESVPENFPIYLYNIPQCSGNDLKPDVAQEIASACKNVVGIKYSYPDMLRVRDYLEINDGTFSVVFGADPLFLPALVIGCDGLVSGCAGPMPEFFTTIYQAYLDGDIEKAAADQRIGAKVCKLLRAGADMAIFKATLDFRGLRGGYMRRPLIDLDEAQKAQLHEGLKKYLSGDC